MTILFFKYSRVSDNYETDVERIEKQLIKIKLYLDLISLG